MGCENTGPQNDWTRFAPFTQGGAEPDAMESGVRCVARPHDRGA